MHIHLPQKPYFLYEIWSYFVCCSSITEYENEMCLSKHWCWGCHEEMSALRKHLYYVCISALLVFIREKQRSSLCRWRLHFLYFPFAVELLFMFACLAPICVFVCLSDPCVAPSPAYSFPTPYQKRERTLNARMYHQRQFSFHSPCFFVFCFTKWPHSRWLMKQRYWKQWLWFFF